MPPPDPTPATPHPGVVTFEDRRTDPPTIREEPYAAVPVAFVNGVPVTRIVTIPADPGFSILQIGVDGQVLKSTRMVPRPARGRGDPS